MILGTPKALPTPQGPCAVLVGLGLADLLDVGFSESGAQVAASLPEIGASAAVHRSEYEKDVVI